MSQSGSSDSDSESGSESGSASGSESDSLFSRGSSSSSSSSEEETDQLPGRAKWLKKVVDTSKQQLRDQKRQEKLVKEKEKQKQRQLSVVDTSGAERERETARSLLKAKLENLTEAEFDKKFSELFSVRGRKGTDGRHLLRQLEFLARVSRMFGPRKEISTLMYMISTMFDISNSTIDDYLDLQKWRTVYAGISRVTTLLSENPQFFLELLPATDMAEVSVTKATDLMKKAGEDEEEIEAVPVNPNAVRTVGNLESFMIRLEAEFTKSLQQINPHTQEYVVRLSDETDLVELVETVKLYYQRVGDVKSAATMALMQVEHMYYKHDNTAKAIMKAHVFNKKWGKYSDIHPASKGSQAVLGSMRNASVVHPASFQGEAKTAPISFEPMQKLEELCSFIYKHGDDRSRARALLCSVYNSALHDRYYQARDLFLISHIQDTIDKSDTKTQILYNRTLVTLGLSAFRLGLIQKAHDCLMGVCTGRVKELLAQGQSRWQDKDPEQEKAERRRQIPYHMHINQDLLDCCHLISAMILELPNIARANQQGPIVSRQFRKYLAIYSNQVFTGPPENTREHVLASAKALLIGDWQRAVKYLTSLEVWNLIPNDGGAAVKEMLVTRVKEEALRLYLISYAQQYESVSATQMCEMFNMDERSVRKIVSKMIFNKDIPAAWDQVDGVTSLVMYMVDATPLQNLVLQVTDRVAYLVESNERILDPLAGTYGYKDEWTRGGDNRKPYDRRGVQPDADDKNRKPRLDRVIGGRGGRGSVAGGRAIPGRGRRDGRGGSRQTGDGAGRGGSVWGQTRSSTAEIESVSLSGNGFLPSGSGNAQRKNVRPQSNAYGSGSRASAPPTYSSSINRPVLSAVGAKDSDPSRRPATSWLTPNN